MAWTTIRTAATLDLPAFAAPVEIRHDPAQHALLALDPATGESEVLTTRLPERTDRRVQPVGRPVETPPDRDPVARSPSPRPLPFRRTVG